MSETEIQNALATWDQESPAAAIYGESIMPEKLNVVDCGFNPQEPGARSPKPQAKEYDGSFRLPPPKPPEKDPPKSAAVATRKAA